MSALLSASTIDPPSTLPVDHLSLTSLKQFMMCPLKWKRRYLDHDPEPSSGKLLLGRATHAALAQHYGFQIERGQGLSGPDVLDCFASEWDDQLEREEIDWGTDSPGELKDSGAGALGVYHARIAPSIVPVSIEREFTLYWPGVEWNLLGFFDLEEQGGALGDYKAIARRMSARDADSDLQPDVFLTARRAEANPATAFRFHTMVRNKTPVAEIVPTTRTDQQLDLLTDRIFGLAREIEWRCETEQWSGAAPGTWFCQTCRYADCPLRLGKP